MATTHLDDLRRAIREQKVLIIVGTGISAQATDNVRWATWKGLLEHGVDFCEERLPPAIGWATNVKKLLAIDDADSWVTAAKKIKDRLLSAGDGAGTLKYWLEDSIGRLKPTKPAILYILKRMHHQGVPIITTNYDGLLSEILELPPFTWEDEDELHNFHNGKHDAIFHLHGHWKKHTSIVFDYESYYNVRGNKLLEAFRQWAGLRKMLFIGYGKGMDDIHFTHFRKWMSDLLPDLKDAGHYLLVRNQEVNDAWNYYSSKIIPIGYGNDYDDLEPFLRRLLPDYLPTDEAIKTNSDAVSPGKLDHTASKQDGETKEALQSALTSLFSSPEPGERYKVMEEFYAIYKNAVRGEDDAFFEKLLSPQPLSEAMKDLLASQPKDPKVSWQARCITASVLTISLISRFDHERMAALVNLVQKGEDQVWQRALTGLALTYGKWYNRVSGYKDLVGEIQELQQVERVQEGLYYFYIALFQKGYENDPIEELTNKFNWHRLPFFEKHQHWFLPFFKEHAEASAAVHNLPCNANMIELLQLLEASNEVCNFDKYAICFHLEKISEEEEQRLKQTYVTTDTSSETTVTVESRIVRLIDIFQREQANLARQLDDDDKVESNRNSLFSLYLNDLKRFIRFFPKQQYENILERQAALDRVPLAEILEANRRHKLDNYLVKQWETEASEARYRKDFKSAIKCYRQILNIKPDYCTALHNMGIAYSNEGENKSAINYYQRALDIKPDDYNVLHNMGIAYSNEGENKSAINYYQRALDIKPDYYTALYNMGIAYASEGDQKTAIHCFQRALEINPDYEDAAFNIACSFSLEKQKNEALFWLEKAIFIEGNRKKAREDRGFPWLLSDDDFRVNRKKAREDGDFQWLWSDDDFIRLTSE